MDNIRVAISQTLHEALPTWEEKLEEVWVAAPSMTGRLHRLLNPAANKARTVSFVTTTAPTTSQPAQDAAVPTYKTRQYVGSVPTFCLILFLSSSHRARAILAPVEVLSDNTLSQPLVTWVEGNVHNEYFQELLDWFAEWAATSALPGAAAETIGHFQAEKLHHLSWQWFMDYIRDTTLFASYKLVTLWLLLNSPQQKMGLAECADRFHSFYLYLSAMGTKAERQTGNPPPLMLRPHQLSRQEVIQLLLKEPRRAFRGAGEPVVFRTASEYPTVFLARRILSRASEEAKQDALAAILTRLEAYYFRHTGSNAHVRAALDRATGLTQ